MHTAPTLAVTLRSSGSSGQFDMAIVAAFEAILASAVERYRMGTDSEFVFTSPHALEGAAKRADSRIAATLSSTAALA